jgi:hypothetical protein
VKVSVLLLLVCLGCKPQYNPDKDPDVLDWYVDEGKTIIYTKQDSIQDAYDRAKYIDSLKKDSIF